MPQEEWEQRMSRDDGIPKVDVGNAQTPDGKPIKCIAYIGSGTLMKDNYVITVRHLFDHDENTYSRTIWVFHQQVDHPLEADLIAITENQTEEDYFNDYACIKLRENLGLPGLPLAKKDPVIGEKVMFGCSVGGAAYFLRFGVVSHFKWFFRKDVEGRLHLSKWTEYHFTTVSPSGPGDSGSAVINTKGQIVGIVYIGVNIYEQMYCFSNPVEKLWDFLEQHHLKYLAYSQHFSQ
jgi:S1-C subfamily serine protease